MISAPIIIFQPTKQQNCVTLTKTKQLKQNPSKKELYTLKTCITAASIGSSALKQWTVGFLHNIGNEPVLGASLANRDIEITLWEHYPLKSLLRKNGSAEEVQKNKHMLYVDTQWNETVEGLKAASLSGDFVFPPLITFDIPYRGLSQSERNIAHGLEAKIEIRDGAHRMEALLQLGKEHYWTLVVVPQRIRV